MTARHGLPLVVAMLSVAVAQLATTAVLYEQPVTGLPAGSAGRSSAESILRAGFFDEDWKFKERLPP